MKYKLVCVDMDGTLLNDKKQVTQRSKVAIARALEKGVKVVICTGRLFTAANEYADMIGIKAPIISANGAYIKEKDRDEVIYKSVLGLDNIKNIMDVIKKYDISPNFYTTDSIYTDKSNLAYQFYSKFNMNAAINNNIKLYIVDNLEEKLEENKEEILKCIAIDDDIEKIKKIKEELSKFEGLEIVSSSINNFEVMKKGVSKGSGVKVLAEYYGYKKESVICIGDNENDLSMIEYAGLGIAMENSEKMVLEVADYITASNNDDGVAKAIEKFVLEDL
jgi:Cof subfamily protein (haloacid dehalogenase superfamily)